MLVLCHDLNLQMDYCYGFVDGSSRHTMNLTSAAWVLYSQAHDFISLGGVFLGPTTNNIVEYHAVIGLLTEASSHGVDHMMVYLDSQLGVS